MTPYQGFDFLLITVNISKPNIILLEKVWNEYGSFCIQQLC